MKNIKQTLKKVNLLAKELNDILQCGIEASLQNIGALPLYYTTDNPIPPNEFCGATEQLSNAHIQTLST